jgi:hypothetical protein
MKNKILGLTTAIALSMIVAGGLWAQSLPGNIFSSPQSDASQGRMRSNADDFIRPDAYTNVKFEKWFGMTSYGQSNRATAGLATKIGGLYLSAFYNGNFWAGKPANNYTESEANLWGDGYKTYRDYGTPSVATGPVNNAAILLGVGDMGFRLTYRTNYQSFSKKDIFAEAPVGGKQYFKSYKAENGYIIPQIAWSMTKDLTAIGLKPYVTVDLAFQRDSLKGEVYITKTETSGEYIFSSGNYFEPKISFGLGGITVLNKDGFKGSIDLDNDLYLRVYNNEYTYYDNTGKPKSAKIKGLNDDTNGLTTNSYFQDVITPSVAGSWSSGNVALRFKLNLPMTIIGTEVTDMDIKDDKGTLQKNGDNTKTSTFAFQPDLRLALSWKVFPKLALYVGGRLQTTPLSSSTVTEKTYTADKEDEHSTTKEKNNGFGTAAGVTHNLRLGTTFNISDNVWVEAQTGLWNSEGKASVFSTTSWGLFEFSSILVGLKF